MKWFRVYHDMVTDPKLHEIARRAKVNRGQVIAAWMAILTTASKNEQRGIAAGINPVQLGYLIDVKPALAERILASIIEQGIMLQDGTVKAWPERQRASDDVNPRVRRSRDLKSKPLKNNEISEQSNVTNFPRFREDKIDSTIVESPPLPPQPEHVSASPQSAIADVFQTSLPALFDPPAASLPAKHAAVPYAEAAEIWNETCGDLLPKIVKWPKGRTSAFAMRFKNDCKGNLEVWRDVCNRIRASDFCCGNSDRHWRADIDFALRESSWVKITEGKYDNVNPTNKHNPNAPFSLTRLLTNIAHTNAKERYDYESPFESGALPQLLGPDDHEAAVAPRNGAGYRNPH